MNWGEGSISERNNENGLQYTCMDTKTGKLLTNKEVYELGQEANVIPLG